MSYGNAMTFFELLAMGFKLAEALPVLFFPVDLASVSVNYRASGPD